MLTHTTRWSGRLATQRSHHPWPATFVGGSEDLAERCDLGAKSRIWGTVADTVGTRLLG